MPPPRRITAARPPFLPLRLDASAGLGGVLGRLGGRLGPPLTRKNNQKKPGASNEREARWNDKHFVLFSSPLSALSLLSRYRYSIASPRPAWYCMPALRAPQRVPRCFLDAPQDAPKTPQVAPRRLKTPPKRPKGASKKHPRRAKAPQDAPRRPQGAPRCPKTTPRGSKRRPKRLLGVILARRGCISTRLRTVLVPSWVVLGTSWRHLGPSWRHLGPSWAHLGPSWPVLGASWPPKDPPKIAPRGLQDPPKTRSNTDLNIRRLGTHF